VPTLLARQDLSSGSAESSLATVLSCPRRERGANLRNTAETRHRSLIGDQARRVPLPATPVRPVSTVSALGPRDRSWTWDGDRCKVLLTVLKTGR
jgi:hypothetical protein